MSTRVMRARPRRSRSTHTARISTTPVTTPRHSACTPSRLSPFCSTAMKSTPSVVPTRELCPPRNEVPPSSTAAITSSSMPAPISGEPAWMRPTNRIAASPTSTPLTANTAIRTRSTVMPDSRAACSLPPTAYTWRPKLVHRITKNASSSASSEHDDRHRDWSDLAVAEPAEQRRSPGLSESWMLSPSVGSCAADRKMASVPSVTTKKDSPALAISTPLVAPSRPPASTVATSASQAGMPDHEAAGGDHRAAGRASSRSTGRSSRWSAGSSRRSPAAAGSPGRGRCCSG